MAPPLSKSSPRPSPLAPEFVPSSAEPPRRNDANSKLSNGTGHIRLPPAAIACRYFQAGYCSRGGKCWFSHDVKLGQESSRAGASSNGVGSAASGSAKVDEADKEECAICYDSPETYGLMTGCDHVFCLGCIRSWRATSSNQAPSQDSYDDDPNALAQTSKNCPLCRVRTKYIVPSVVYPAPPTDGSENVVKKQIIDVYLKNLSKIPCRHFTQSLRQPSATDRAGTHTRPPRPHCQFGNDCHYRHEIDGKRYIFNDRELQRHKWLRKAVVRRRRVESVRGRSRSLLPPFFSEIAAHAILVDDGLDMDMDDDDDDDDNDADADFYDEYDDWIDDDLDDRQAAMAFLMGAYDDGAMFEWM